MLGCFIAAALVSVWSAPNYTLKNWLLFRVQLISSEAHMCASTNAEVTNIHSKKTAIITISFNYGK